MNSRFCLVAILAAAGVAPAGLRAQDITKYTTFTLDGRTVQFHGFASQGFMYSNENNFLTMKTSDGSFALTDGGVNVGVQVTDKFRVGAQMYLRHLGDLSGGVPQLDWAFGDYKFTNWLGVRAGKVKTALGLYNDTQDLDFLNTWALPPQGIYPLDVRSATIAHEGGDIYGSIAPKHLGSLAYTAYFGLRPNDPGDGYVYGLSGIGVNLDGWSGKTWGGDLRWTTPIKGLTAGASLMYQKPHGNYTSAGTVIDYVTKKNQTTQFYGQYTFRGLRIDGEYRRNYRDGFSTRDIVYDGRSFYVSAAYRISKRFEVGGYDSHYYANNRIALSPPANHVFDKVATVRVDLTSHWNVKVEGHFMDGYAASNNAHGFYAQTNPQGLQPTTNMLVIRTGYFF